MKKLRAFFFTAVVVASLFLSNTSEATEILFNVYQHQTFLQSFKTKDEAIQFAKRWAYSSVRETPKENWIWNNYPPFTVYQNQTFVKDFKTASEAIAFADRYANSYVYYRGNNQTVWSREEARKNKVLLNVPLISQLPELPRGCEVTSLAMVLQYTGINASKMTLAKQIKKDPTPYKKSKGQTFFGNPYNGFVGDMYSFKKPGYGVYHGPIKELAETYRPNDIVNLTGSRFEDILFSLHRGKPVWVIINSRYSKLPNSQFQTWNTPTGKVWITYREHSVVLTGYDNTYVYFNDPLTKTKNKKILIQSFKAGWEQMGKQAVVILN